MVAPAPQVKVHNGVVLTGITAGHAVSHFLNQSLLVMLPALRDTLGIDAVQIGALTTARELAAGLTSVPGGILCDRFRRQWGRVMALCMGTFALGWLLVALSGSYTLMLLGMVVASVSSSVWHLPSMAALSYHFSQRRGTALSIHGVGGNIGDVLGPVATGLALTYLTWRGVLSLYSAVPLLLAAASLWAFRGIGPQGEGTPVSASFRTQLKQSVDLLRSPVLWKVNLVFGLRGMCYQIYTTFLPLFLADEVGLDTKGIGLHLGLLFTIGIVVSPIMGYASDRLGRKAVVVPTLIVSAVLSLALALFGQGIMVTIIITLLGFVLRSDYSILSAAALDIVGHDVATTTLGVLSFSRFVLAASAPLIAGVMYERWGMDPPLYLVTALFAVASVLLIMTPLPRPQDPQ